jgi:hypothetical protein
MPWERPAKGHRHRALSYSNSDGQAFHLTYTPDERASRAVGFDISHLDSLIDEWPHTRPGSRQGSTHGD